MIKTIHSALFVSPSCSSRPVQIITGGGWKIEIDDIFQVGEIQTSAAQISADQYTNLILCKPVVILHSELFYSIPMNRHTIIPLLLQFILQRLTTRNTITENHHLLFILQSYFLQKVEKRNIFIKLLKMYELMIDIL